MDEHANNGQAESSVADGREETDEVTAGQAPARLDPAIRVRLLIEAGDFAAARRLLPEIEDAGQVADLRRRLGLDRVALVTWMTCLAGLLLLSLLTLFH
ncbi:MAG: hypothetical protein DRI34_14685 [Deltaproteobacteria bacterium]|nr:MAG: hypothetical protein DRI34_14685 [Deltaproteobacteria bacterium]